MSQSIDINVSDYVATVTINRPEKLNAMDASVFEGLIEAGDSIALRNDVRAVVLTGAGDNFSSGIDVNSLMGDGNFMQRAFSVGDKSPANFAQRAAVVWQEIPQPVIAAIQGKCFGGGFQLALAADIRIGSSDIDMRILEIKWGIIPDMGISQTAIAVLALDKLKELMWTGRSVGADEALKLGLLTRTADNPQEAALELATAIAAKSPDAVKAGKAMINQAWRQHLSEGYQLEASYQKAVIGQANQAEAVMANFEKRIPQFK